MYVRYDCEDEKGEKRRDRNERFNETSPIVHIPPIVQYLWNWYFDISMSLQRVRDGVCRPIAPSEFVAWEKISGNIVHPFEFTFLRAMDAAYTKETNIELKAYNERQKAAQDAAIAAAKSKRGRR